MYVAINGQYLRRKTVKISDPVYLAEEGRNEIIEKIWGPEDKMSFRDYEMGGINPSRYKTLRKIQKQFLPQPKAAIR